MFTNLKRETLIGAGRTIVSNHMAYRCIYMSEHNPFVHSFNFTFVLNLFCFGQSLNILYLSHLLSDAVSCNSFISTLQAHGAQFEAVFFFININEWN